MTKQARVVFIGAAGEMCRVAVEAMAKAPGEWDFVLADLNPDILGPLATKITVDPRVRASVQRCDLYNAAGLRSMLDGADLVVLGAGPFVKTFEPVIEVCLDLKIPYLDFDDDVESTEHALRLDAKAKAAGIPIYIGCGASPGMTNVMAVDAANDLDVVERIDMAWLVGDEPSVGKAVLHHMLSIAAGEARTWVNGGPTIHQSYQATEKFPIRKGEPDVSLYETAHPEPVTFPRKYPEAKSIRCYGGLDPAPLNGIFRGVGEAIRNGEITADDAVDFIYEVANGGLGNLKGWRIAWRGMREQVKRGEATNSQFWKYLAMSGLKRKFPYKGGLLVRAYGTKDGKAALSSRRMQMNPGQGMEDMGGATGTPCAAFAVLALQESGQRAGVFCPEDWADPAKFYDALAACGVPREHIVEAF
jgi:saccharopine dehydrogenase-like NADP-dependent oxidoreductase